MRFVALDVSLGIIRQLVPLVRTIRRHDRKLAGQIVAAASSTPLNIGEGSRRAGRDRGYLFSVAYGSNEEVRVALLVAMAWEYFAESKAEAVLEDIDRLQRLIHGLLR